VLQLELDAKLAGTARYIADLEFPGLLHAAIARSRVSHDWIRAVHTEKARRVPGVRGVVTASQLGHESFGQYTPDWEILARDKVRFIGDEIAAVAAVTPEAAKEAADLIEFEIEELPAVFDASEALAPGAPVLWDERPDNISSLFTISRRDVEGAFRRPPTSLRACTPPTASIRPIWNRSVSSPRTRPAGTS
jgi:CO/xanthine dehydrogenase Mo-binding subunit